MFTRIGIILSNGLCSTTYILRNSSSNLKDFCSYSLFLCNLYSSHILPCQNLCSSHPIRFCLRSRLPSNLFFLSRTHQRLSKFIFLCPYAGTHEDWISSFCQKRTCRIRTDHQKDFFFRALSHISANVSSSTCASIICDFLDPVASIFSVVSAIIVLVHLKTFQWCNHTIHGSSHTFCNSPTPICTHIFTFLSWWTTHIFHRVIRTSAVLVLMTFRLRPPHPLIFQSVKSREPLQIPNPKLKSLTQNPGTLKPWNLQFFFIHST